MAEFDAATQSNGSPKLSANSAVTDRMVEAAWTAYVEARDGRPMHAAIKAALREQPAPEPVAWRWTESNGKHWFDWSTDWNHHDRAKDMGFPTQYAYTAAPQPDAACCTRATCRIGQRVPLTDNEINRLANEMVKGDKSVNWLARAIERAHGIGGEE